MFKSFVFLTKKDENDRNEAIENIYKDSLIKFNRKVFEEDKLICEKVQVGVKNSPYQGELSDEEKRVCEFQKSYNNIIKR